MALPERLKTARKHLGKNQEEIAAALGMSARGWQAYEHGRSIPGGQVFEALARMGFDANWLLTGEGPMLRADAVLAGAALPLDKELMREIIIRCDAIFAAMRTPWPAEKKAELIMLLHDEVVSGDMERAEVEKTALRLVKLAS